MKGYPITLVGLEDSRCIVIGGGKVAWRKVRGLQEAGARPIVISPILCPELAQQAEQGAIEVVAREYRPGDLSDATLVIAATNDPATNRAVWQEAQASGCLVNVVDDPAHCTFYVPATVRRGDLTVSISTGGQSPALARRLREMLEALLDEAYAPYVELLGALRPLVQQRIADPTRRRRLWEALLDAELLEIVRSGSYSEAKRRAEHIIDTFR